MSESLESISLHWPKNILGSDAAMEGWLHFTTDVQFPSQLCPMIPQGSVISYTPLNDQLLITLICFCIGKFRSQELVTSLKIQKKLCSNISIKNYFLKILGYYNIHCLVIHPSLGDKVKSKILQYFVHVCCNSIFHLKLEQPQYIREQGVR